MLDYIRGDTIVLELEGKQPLDHNDPGGETKWGVARQRHPEISDAAWQSFSFENARAIRQTEYWLAAHCDAMPWALGFALYDACINQGLGSSVLRLQKALGTVACDGRVGAQTLTAIPWKEPQLSQVLWRFMFYRAAAYGMDLNAKFFLAGWLNRLGRVAEVCREGDGKIILGA